MAFSAAVCAQVGRGRPEFAHRGGGAPVSRERVAPAPGHAPHGHGPGGAALTLAHLPDDMRATALAYVWQNVAATAAAYGDERPSGDDDWQIPETSVILERCIETDDPHVLKFAEAASGSIDGIRSQPTWPPPTTGLPEYIGPRTGAPMSSLRPASISNERPSGLKHEPRQAVCDHQIRRDPSCEGEAFQLSSGGTEPRRPPRRPSSKDRRSATSARRGADRGFVRGPQGIGRSWSPENHILRGSPSSESSPSAAEMAFEPRVGGHGEDHGVAVSAR
jgi:hypothetical protein